MNENPYHFPETHWSESAAIRNGSAEERLDAFASLAERYRMPVFAYLAASTRDPILAEDLTQEFFLWALENDFFGKAAEERGKFRSFLLRSLRNFRVSEYRKSIAGTRMPNGGFVTPSPDGSPFEGVESVTPEDIFERASVCDVIDKAVNRLRVKSAADGRYVHFSLLREYVIDPAMEGARRPTMSELSVKYGLTHRQVETWIDSERDALKQELLDEVCAYARSAADESEELAGLLKALHVP